MPKQGEILNRLSSAADLPDEPFPGVPLIEIAGQNRVLVEHHCGVTEYGTHQIQVRVKYGYVCVCGQGLELARMTKGQLIITGRIESIRLIGRKA